MQWQRGEGAAALDEGSPRARELGVRESELMTSVRSARQARKTCQRVRVSRCRNDWDAEVSARFGVVVNGQHFELLGWIQA